MELWDKLKELKWYWKILLFVPFVIILILKMIWAFSPQKINKKIITGTKKKTDEVISKIEKSIILEKKEIGKLEKEIEKIEIKKEKLQTGKEKIKDKYKKRIKNVEKTKSSVTNMSDLFSDLRKYK